MAANKKLFITSSVFVAFIDRVHPKHVQAAACFRYFYSQKYQLFTSYLNISDAYRVIFDDISPFLARDFLRAIIMGSINILYPSAADTKAAVKALVSSQATNELNFADAQTEVLAYRNSIDQIFSLDPIYLLFGLTSFVLPV